MKKVILTFLLLASSCVLFADGYSPLIFTTPHSWTGLQTFNAGIAVKNGATSQGFVRLYEDSDNGANYIQLMPQASLPADLAIYFPATAGNVPLLETANTFTAAQTVDTGSNGASAPATWASMVTGKALVNDTASTAGTTVQDSPALTFEGHAWDTDTGPQDDKWQWKIYADHASGTTTTSQINFVVMKSPGGVDAAPGTPFSITNGGAIQAASSTWTGSYFGSGSTAGTLSGANTMLLGYGAITASSGSFLSWEGSSADTNEGEIQFPNVSGDRVITIPDEGGIVQLNGEGTLTADDTTPSMTGFRIWKSVANSGATVITDLDNPVVNQLYIIICGSGTNPISINDGGNFSLAGNWTPDTVGDNIVLYVAADNVYYEISRANS